MDTDQIIGRFKDVSGQAEAAVGDVIGDRETQVRGRAREAAGVAQTIFGQAKDALGDTLGDTTKSAEKVLHSARDVVDSGASTIKKEVNARPLVAILIAALVGFVVASLMHSAPQGRRR